MKKKAVLFTLSILAVALLTLALLTNWKTTTWIMYGFFIVCLYIGFLAIEKALKEMGIK